MKTMMFHEAAGIIVIELFTCWSHLLITFCKQLDPDQAGQNVRPDLESGGIPIRNL